MVGTAAAIPPCQNIMDIQRPDLARQRKRRRLIFASVGLIALAVVTLGLARLKPAAPPVDRSIVWMGTVERGEMLRQVRGNGTLVPEEILSIPTLNAGRVERILILPGAAVKAEMVLVELINPEVEKAVFDAEWQLKGAEAELVNVKAQLETQRLNQQAAVARVQADFNNAKLEAEINEELAKSGLVPELVRKQTKAKAEELSKLLAIEEERLRIYVDSIQAQRAVQESRVEQLRAQLQLRQQHAESLKVRAGIDGVLQKLGDGPTTLQVGQQLPAGALVARVANPAKLKAEIKIYETQAKDVQIGQIAAIDTRTGVDARRGIVAGKVVRVDPAVQNGTVTVDVALEGPLPKGARPDLSVEGTIELERLANVLHVGKPVNGAPESTAGLFKVTEGGKAAERVPVRLGRASVSTIEVIEGLREGDQILLNDMSTWDRHDRVRLN
jgi:HlyD family secretion protein